MGTSRLVRALLSGEPQGCYLRVMVTADFELKVAYIDGAKAGHSGMEPDRNPFRETVKRDFWTLGYRSATSGWHPTPSFEPPVPSFHAA